MKTKTLPLIMLVVFVFGALSGCSTGPKSPDVTNQVRSALDQAGLKDVDVSQDRDKGVVKLSGSTDTADQKAQAEVIAKSIASNQVIANEINVRAKQDDTSAQNDKDIEKDLDAALKKHRLQKDVKYDVKNGVITLKGTVASQSQRNEAEKTAASVANVKQVVNELELKNNKGMKATAKKTSS